MCSEEEAIEKLTTNLNKFLQQFTFLNAELKNSYQQLANAPLSIKKLFINEHLHPQRHKIREYVEIYLKKFNHSVDEFKPKDLEKFCLYLDALASIKNYLV